MITEINTTGLYYALVNSLGQILIENTALSNEEAIDIRHMGKGMYYLLISDKNNLIGHKKVFVR